MILYIEIYFYKSSQGLPHLTKKRQNKTPPYKINTIRTTNRFDFCLQKNSKKRQKPGHYPAEKDHMEYRLCTQGSSKFRESIL
jgi:hypothetical protein